MRTSPIIALVAPTEVRGSFSASARTRTRTPRHRGLTVVGFALQLLLHAAAPQPPRALCPPAARQPASRASAGARPGKRRGGGVELRRGSVEVRAAAVLQIPCACLCTWL